MLQRLTLRELAKYKLLIDAFSTFVKTFLLPIPQQKKPLK